MLNFSIGKNFFSGFKWPSKNQWGQFFKVLTKKEKMVFFTLFTLLTGGAIFISANFYFVNTKVVPAQGGKLVEGVIGQPRFINPIYASQNDTDRDLTELIFSGLMKYDGNGNIISDLAKEIKIEDNGKTYRVFLKDNVLWSNSDSSPSSHQLTADDVIFTVQIIQSADFKSPLRVNWIGIETEKISDLEMVFRLRTPYSAFLENLTLKIIPKHIWQDISSQEFPLSVYNLKPVAAGPYRIDKLNQESSGKITKISLKINTKYHGEKPYLQKIEFKFYEDEEGLIKAAKKGEINGFAISENSSFENNSFKNYNFALPRYFAVFFNPNESKVLENKNVRQALNYGTNKKELIGDVLNSKAVAIDSPILPELYDFAIPEEIYEYDLEKAKQILDDAGYKETENGGREKTIIKEPAFQFKSFLETGSQGIEVQELQKCLAKFPDIYPAGIVSGYFRSQTKTAVIEFQEKYKNEILTPSGYTSGTGSTGPNTRKKLNEVCFASP
ncbi:ABC transporter substrate-binding protein, partial [Patescibacteria group bacterium]